METYELVRDVSNKECPWFKEGLAKGTVVYKFKGATYGCIADGMAISLTGPKDNPFYECPRDALTPVVGD